MNITPGSNEDIMLDELTGEVNRLTAANKELRKALQAMYDVFNTDNEKELESYFRKPFLIARQALKAGE